MKAKIDLNCDLGESYGAFKVGRDSEIMPHITSANIACGFHAGDPVTMAQTISLAKKHSVAVGAHPGFPDLVGFGRREMQLDPQELRDYIIYQTSALQGFAETVGLSLQHVKPHGAFYNMAARDEKIAKTTAEAVRSMNASMIVFAPPNSALEKAANQAGLRTAKEFFADRAYNSDGSLVSRKQPHAVIQAPKEAVKRAVEAATEGTVSAIDGEVVDLGEVHTICVHGDTPAAVEFATVLRKGLIRASVEVRPVGSFI